MTSSNRPEHYALKQFVCKYKHCPAVKKPYRIEVWHFKKLPVCPHCHHRLRVVGNA